MINIVSFIYYLNSLGFFIWLENGKLKYKQYKECLSKDHIIAQLKNHKLEIIDFLILNNCYAPNLSSQQYIYKSNQDSQHLSFAQERLWFIEKYEGGTNAYNLPIIFELSRDINLEALEASIRNIINRHEILRTVIREDDEGKAYQKVLDYPLEIARELVTDLLQLEEIVKKDVNHIYNLSDEYPIKVCLYKCKKNENDYLCIVIHHIAFDGWSYDIFLRELETYYDYYLAKERGIEAALGLAELRIQYKDFAIWQKNYLSHVIDEQLNYWRQKLSGYENLNLLTDKPRPSQIDYEGDEICFEIEEKISKDLRKLAQQMKVSLYSVLLSGYYLMLRSYSNQDDIIIGTPISNRHYNDVEELIGFFVNTLVLRIVIDPKTSMQNFLKNIGQEVIDAHSHQDLPFEKLVDELKIEIDSSRHPIFQAMFAVQRFGDTIRKQHRWKPYKGQSDIQNIARFDISTFIDDSQEKLQGQFNYSTSLFTRETILGYIETYVEILRQLASLANDKERQEQIKISDLKYITEERYKEIIIEWNKTDKEYPDKKTIQRLFEEQVERRPDRVALVYEDNSLTYKELNNRANKLANYLRNKYAINPDTLIALVLNRSEQMLIAILAVLKSGAAYVPIDTSYPDERISYILKDTSAKVVITNSIYEERLRRTDGNNEIDYKNQDIKNEAKTTRINIVSIDSKRLQEQLELESVSNPETETLSTNLAYIIYTSGTTGKPKGVMVQNKAVINYTQNVFSHINLSTTDKVDFSTSIGFDLTVTTTLSALLLGAEVCVYNNELQNLESYKAYLLKNNINVIKLVPSYFELLVDFLPISQIDKVILGGEKIGSQFIDKVKPYSGKLKIYDEYGPTETTVGVYVNEIFPMENLTVGKIYNNYKVYVLNKQLDPLPLMAIGELYVSGEGVALGYLNRLDLTAERFIVNPFQSEEERKQNKNGRLYKTGDLVRWLANGNLGYIGRNDFQIKIRGYRIELAEIENAISAYERVRHAAVVCKEYINQEKAASGSQYLLGYYVSDEKLQEEEIIKYLQQKLPEYMVPKSLVYLERMPLTVNGKLDRKALPELKISDKDSYVAPRNELESKLCKIWADVLGIAANKVGIYDDFFRLGGDSIVSIQVVSRLRQRLGVTVSVKDIFNYKNIARLCDNVLNKTETCNEIIFKTEQGILSGEVPLLPIQEWFFQQDLEQASYWNQSFLIKVPLLNIDKLRASLNKLVRHHDVLNLRYKKVGSEYIQYYDKEAEVEKLKILDLKILASKEGEQEFQTELDNEFSNWQSNFNLEQGGVYSIGYVYGYEDRSGRVYFALHHLIVDSVSWRILVEDLKELYNDKELGAKGSSYRQWVNTVREYANINKSENAYWHSLFVNYQSSINKLYNSLNLSKNLQNFAKVDFNYEQTRQLLQETNKAYNTQINDILLTALGYALFKITSSKINYIVLEGHGREQIDSSIDISRTVGWFTTIYPVLLEIKEDLGSTIKFIKESLRAIPNKGIGYGALIGYERSKLLRISFNYLGQFDQKNISQNVSEFWGITSESSGINASPSNKDGYILNVNGLVIDNKLKFNVASKLDIITTNILVKEFKLKLEEIITHITKQERSYLTSSDIGNITSQEYLDKLQLDKEIDGVYLANSLQQGFIYHKLNQGEIDDAYIVQLIWQYNSSLNSNKLKEAWEYAQKKYASLRIRFAWEEELVQIIDKEGILQWNYIDISKELDTDVQKSKIKQIQEKDRLEPYQLDKNSLFRIYLIKQKEDLYTFIFSSHHAILDGWSNPLLLGYVHEIYLKLLDKKPILFQADHSYNDAQKYLQENQNINNDYWHNYLSQIEERSDLKLLLASNNITNSTNSSAKQIRISEYKHIKSLKRKELTIDGNLYSGLKNLIQKEGVTINAVLQYIWHKILKVYSNSNQTVVGITVSGRNIPINDIETSVGLYINTLPLLVDHLTHKQKSVLEAIKAIQGNISEFNSRSNISLAKLQKKGERLFDSLFVYENYPNPVNQSAEDRVKISFKNAIEKLDYPLGVIAYENPIDNELKFTIDYAKELFDQSTIDSLLSIAKTLLQQIINDPSQEVENLSYLNQASYNQIINIWNETDKDYPSDKTIHKLFEEQVQRTSDNIAIIYEDTKLTYKELNERANQLAAYIIETSNNSITPDTLIALCLDRSEHMLIAIIATLKAGAAYVPMDPSFPDERIAYILKDTNASIVLTNEIYKERLESIEKQTNNLALNNISLDSKFTQKQLQTKPTTNHKTQITSSNLAYVIYTSGTTGNPKGVMIEHKGVVNTLLSLNHIYDITKGSKITAFTSYVFDVSVSEFFTGLFKGAELYLLSKKIRTNPELISKYILDNNINYIYLPPILLSVLPRVKYESLQGIIYAGEPCDADAGRYWSNSYKLYNYYGPTEITIYALGKQIIDGDTNLIGIPINNTKAYVLSSNLTPLPIGAIGELYIGGAGLARGYLNLPDLTREKFISNPFQILQEKQDNSFAEKGKNSRLYKTGDLVRWLPCGNLEYVGRNDFQVKIRGYRIELGEIENILSSYDGIKQSVVLAKEHLSLSETATDNKYLIGYYVSDSELPEENILSYLSSRLPDYMVPNILIRLPHLPLTINGKLDRKSLPDPELTNSDNYLAPRNELETRVCNIWAEVLGLAANKVSINDDFFRLGGNSILAIRLVSKLNKELDVRVSIASIFKHNSIEKLVKNCLRADNAANNEGELVITKASSARVEEQSLSFAQERLWFIEKYEEGTNAYNIPIMFKLSKHTNIEILENSIKAIVERHESLRTIIKEDAEGNFYQLVINSQEYPLVVNRIQVADLLQLDLELNKATNHIYDLTNEYPIKICLYELTTGSSNSNNRSNTIKDYYLSIIIHHIAFDGWSADIFFRELQEYYLYYNNQSEGLITHLNLPDLSIQYKDFALWQRSYLSGERLERQLSYWKNKLEGYEPLNLVTDKPRPNQINYAGADVDFEIDEYTSQNLRELAKELNVSLYSLLLAAYCLMLSSYSNRDDIVIGSPVANRHYSQIENLIGFFVNTLVLRVKINSKVSIKEFIQIIGNEVIDAQLHQDLPFEKLVEELNILKDTSRHPIFQVMFGIENFGNKYNNIANLLETYETGSNLYKIAKFDISTFINDSEVKLKGSFNYAVSLYDKTAIEGFIRTYIYILRQLADLGKDEQRQKQKKIESLSYLDQEKYEQIIKTWNLTEKEYPNNKTIHQLFEEQVKKTPEAIAIIYEDNRLTYRELNNRANQLANYLIEKHNIVPDKLIVLCLNRSEQMLIAILAVLKSGAAYVPIDPSYPDERLTYLLKDTNSKIVLTSSEYEQRLQKIVSLNSNENSTAVTSQDTKILVLDSILQQQLVAWPTCNPSTDSLSNNLAYVIYTSGTTGNPKGVMIEHKSLVNSTLAAIKHRDISIISKVLQSASYAFDSSLLEIYPSLLAGATLFILKESLRKDIYQIHNYCSKNKITTLFLTTKLAEEFLYLEDDNLCLTRLIVAGEKFSTSRIANFQIINEYGPTENTICSTYFYVTAGSLSPSIGIPISNTKCYVFNPKGHPLPVGAIGELYLGGVGLARGYLNSPDLTAERFIANPFQNEKEKQDKKHGVSGRNSRLYKTGDLVRWLPDGNLEYIGRNDFQVKIRGYRIELNEIENILGQYQDVKQCVVLAKERLAEDSSNDNANISRYLVGYYTTEKGFELEEEVVVSYIRSKLPDYMVPNILVHLESLPLTSNGKLDRKELPDPKFGDNEDNYVAPRSELEEKVSQIWAEVLGLAENQVSIYADFFRLGGNSILAIKLAIRLNKKLHHNINVSDLFKNSTVEGLVRYLKINNEDAIVIEKATITKVEQQLLSFAQKRLWFIERYEEGTNAYNIPLIFELAKDTNLQILESSIESIVNRHEILRTAIREDVEGNPYQQVLDYPLIIAKTIVFDQIHLEQEIKKAASHIYDLSTEYPIKVYIYDRKDNKQNYLGIVIHHIAFDGWSVDIFIKELISYYNYYLNKLQDVEYELDLPKLNIQYKDFSVWQKQYLSGHILETQLAYWKNKLEGYETLNLATDKSRVNKLDYLGNNIYFELDEDTSKSLRALAKELKVSLYSLLLAGYFLMLQAHSNQDDIIVGSSVANRHYNQVENLIGFFINSLALRIQINPNEYVTDFIKKIGNEVVVAQRYQDLPFEKVVEELDITKDTSRHPIFQVMFGVQNLGNIQENRILQKYNDSGNIYNIAKFDISTFIDDSQVRLQGCFNYRISLFADKTITTLIETYVEILKQFSILAGNSHSQQKTKLLNINYLNAEQYKQLIYDCNDTDKAYPSNQTIQELFETQVVKTPENIALIYKEQQLTYEHLNEQANKLAHYLKENFEITPDTLIALCLDRDENMIVAILAILKTGGAYVPIDVTYPNERIGYILEDTSTNIVLTNELHKKRLEEIKNTYKKDLTGLLSRKSNDKTAILAINSRLIQEKLQIQATTNPDSYQSNANLAYVIYTSGTTGNPKGVMVEHQAVVNYIFNVNTHISLTFKDVVDFSTSISFDLSVTTTLCSLCLGARIAVYEHQLQDLESYRNHLIRNNINVIKLVPSYFELLIDILPTTQVNKVILGGEKLNHFIINKLYEAYNSSNVNLKIYDEYGPTEATVGTCNNQIYQNESLSIGKLYDNYKAYILNAQSIPLPVGAVGELYIGGLGLARGYLNQTELTAERFIANPFRSKEELQLGKNARLYKTGDLVRWLPDGNLEYIGRNDFQVKIRGYRIELGEIESILLQHKDVQQTIVVTQKAADLANNSGLVAYIVHGEFTPTIMDLNNFLSARLPEYMIPSVFIYLEKLPITINGKIDRKALPRPEAENIDNYTGPKNEIEMQLCRIWAEVLSLPVEQIGINNDFFKIGGNSILAIKLISKLNNYYTAHLKVADIFVYKNIELLAPRVFQTKDRYQTIVKLNNSYKKPNMFMIHPGTGGCEVYASLASQLANHFSCYGIDSYNLHNETKIDNLRKLSEYYLSYIEKIMIDTAQEEYNLLGWSLGGQISLEIASILEQRKISKIRVYLLDPILYDDYLLSFKYGAYSDKLTRLKDEYRAYAIAQGYDKLYIEKVIPNIEIEYKLQNQKISTSLNNTQILLFKAMLRNDTNTQDIFNNERAKYIFALKYNNADKLLKDTSAIKLIEVDNANHSDILRQEDFLKLHIIDWHANNVIK